MNWMKTFPLLISIDGRHLFRIQRHLSDLHGFTRSHKCKQGKQHRPCSSTYNLYFSSFLYSPVRTTTTTSV